MMVAITLMTSLSAGCQDQSDGDPEVASSTVDGGQSTSPSTDNSASPSQPEADGQVDSNQSQLEFSCPPVDRVQSIVGVPVESTGDGITTCSYPPVDPLEGDLFATINHAVGVNTEEVKEQYRDPAQGGGDFWQIIDHPELGDGAFLATLGQDSLASLVMPVSDGVLSMQVNVVGVGSTDEAATLLLARLASE
jgi:hypothetical protein